jgi:hypothetical protein
MLSTMNTPFIHYDSGPSLGRGGARRKLFDTIFHDSQPNNQQQPLYAALVKTRLANFPARCAGCCRTQFAPLFAAQTSGWATENISHNGSIVA